MTMSVRLPSSGSGAASPAMIFTRATPEEGCLYFAYFQNRGVFVKLFSVRLKGLILCE